MSLMDELNAFHAAFANRVEPERVALYEAKIEELRHSGVLDRALAVGDCAPNFTLRGARGRSVRLEDALRRGPVVLTFYRGGWCSYCNLQLRAYQETLPAIEMLGARLLAVSPQTSDNTLSTAEKNALTFEVLCDVGNGVAERDGVVFPLPAELREVYGRNGIVLPAINGVEEWALPAPATFVLAPDGYVVLASVEADHRRRLEPAEIVGALSALPHRAA